MKRRLIREMAKTNQPFACYWCHSCFTSFKGMTVDHVHALGEGGKHEIENIVLSCDSCNNKRGAETSKRLQLLDPEKHCRNNKKIIHPASSLPLEQLNKNTP